MSQKHPSACIASSGDFDELLGSKPVIRGHSMKITMRLLAKLGVALAGHLVGQLRFGAGRVSERRLWKS